MFELYGITRSIDEKGPGMGFEENESRELIATFSSKKNLDAYLSKRLLKNPVDNRGYEAGRKFRSNSDLGHFNDYEVETIEEPREIPHDPI